MSGPDSVLHAGSKPQDWRVVIRNEHGSEERQYMQAYLNVYPGFVLIQDGDGVDLLLVSARYLQHIEKM